MSETKPNISQLAREHGLNPYTVHTRLFSGMPLEEALSKPVDKQSIANLARKNGLKPGTVYRRLKNGMTLEQALNKPAEEGYFKEAWQTQRSEMIEKSRLSRLKTYVATSPEGKQITIAELSEFCAEHGLNCASLRNYIKRGKPYQGWTIKHQLSDSHPASQPTE